MGSAWDYRAAVEHDLASSNGVASSGVASTTLGTGGLGLDDIPTAALHLDVHGTVVDWNPAAADLLGALHDALPGSVRVTDVLGREILVVPNTDHVERSTVTIRPAGAPARRLTCLATATTSGTHPPGAIVLLVPTSDQGGAPAVEPWVDLAGRARSIADASTSSHASGTSHSNGDGQASDDVDDTVSDGAVCAAIGIVGLDEVNAAFGRTAGDAVLEEIHRRLHALAGDDGVADRTAGDRYSVIVSGSAPAIVAAGRSLSRFGDRLVEAVRTPIDTPAGRASVGGAVGLATGDPRAALVLMDAADRNLDAALRLGAGSVCREGEAPSFPSRPAERPRSDHAGTLLSGSLVDAVAAGEITVRYQPVVDVHTGDVVELEAFARWRHEGRELSAAEFLGVARQTGVMVEVGKDVLRHALAGTAGTGMRLSVNVSGRELADPSFRELIVELLEHHEVEPGQLQLELAADVELERLDEVAERVREIRDLGVRVLLDGVGGGAADLAALRRLHVDGVKVDAATTRALSDGTPWTQQVARSTMDLLRSLGIDVIAKGVEDDRQHHAVTASGCRFAQGYHYAAPVTADELHGVLRR